MDFDWSEIGKVLTYLAPIVFFLLFNVIFRKQQQQKGRLTVIKSLLSEIDYNQMLMDSFAIKMQIKKFKVATWKRNKDKMDYIDPSLHSMLAQTHEIAEEFNRQIDKAKQYKSTAYLAGMEVGRLRVPLARSKQGLEEWLEMNKDKKKLTIGRLKSSS